MVIGSIAALYQKKIKRLMAYSGIANVGYILIGIASGTIYSMTGLLIYLLLIPLGIINYNKKSKSVENDLLDEDQQDIL